MYSDESCFILGTNSYWILARNDRSGFPKRPLSHRDTQPLPPTVCVLTTNRCNLLGKLCWVYFPTRECRAPLNAHISGLHSCY
ncbi:hypothetical protein CEXT_353771 [Caerostris extrusa]|uniref:Transposase n=1 Tax=Caerostris extrusa TaxID=172846 RepID=A0AAV4MAZ5_CAEEX|nr:hypothetical protein CEXT_353771 [Caerostris extrusa]